MKKLSHLFQNEFIRLMIILLIMMLSFCINKYAGCTLFIVLLIDLLFSKDNKLLLYSFLFLSFNDEILVVDFLKGSISRVLMIFIIIKLFYIILKNKIKPGLIQIITSIILLISSLVGLKYFDMEVVITVANIFIFILFSMVYKTSDKSEVNIFFERLCYTVILSVFFAILYGLATVNFMQFIQGESVIYRFNGTYEPNFMCMYINLAILSLIAIREKINKQVYYIIFAIFVNAVILTASMTGFLTLFVTLLLYLIICFKDFKKIVMRSGLVVLYTLILFVGIKFVTIEDFHYYFNYNHKLNSNDNSDNTIPNEQIENQNKVDNKSVINNKGNKIEDDAEVLSGEGIGERIKNITGYLKNGKIDEVTSGRTAIARAFVKNLFKKSVLNILFGTNPANKKVYTPFFDKECYAHNSYIDFITNFGIIGACLIVFYLYYVSFKNVFLGFNIENSSYALNIKLIRIMLLIFALTLTFYTKRMFLVYFLL